MPVDITVSHNAALQVIQQAALSLARWANPNFQQPPLSTSNSTAVSGAVATAQQIVGWSDTLDSLQLVFDTVHLSSAATQTPNYRPAWALDVKGSEAYPRIPYAQSQPPNAEELAALKAEIVNTTVDWENLAQLTLFVEKFGSHLSAGVPDIALIDLARSTAAIAAALAQQPKGNQLALIGGDLMGVQKFIYTISSEGALKSLRARSFYLELAAEEIVQQLLDLLQLPRTNIIYAGASKFYLLAAATDVTKQAVQQIQERFNQWLLDEFQRKVFLAIDRVQFPASDLNLQTDSKATDTLLSKHWQDVSRKLSDQASRKFRGSLDQVLKIHTSHTPCKVCHRDDTTDLQPLSQDAGAVLACRTCRDMFDLGGKLPGIQAIVRSHQQLISSEHRSFDVQDSITFEFKATDSLPDYSVCYYIFDNLKRAKAFPHIKVLFLVNNWTVADYSSIHCSPTLLLLADYAQLVPLPDKPEKFRFIQASEMAERSRGIQRVGYLRMDVDRLSQIFVKGLGEKQTLPRLASLSRQMTYFFKIYLNSLATNRKDNFLNITGCSSFQRLPEKPRQVSWVHERNLLFIYAGGDDLFISGAWDEVVDFAFDVYQSFRAYTGIHPGITLSAGMHLSDAKFPLYQAAAAAGKLEDEAKDNDRNSLALFGQVFKWNEWLGTADETVLKSDDRQYLQPYTKPVLFGVLPFVLRLIPQLDTQLSKGFIQSLLLTAQIQRQMLEKAKDAGLTQQRDVRYFLHLPRVAYTLAQLPKDKDDNFKDIRQSLKHPYNAPYFGAIATWIELLTRSS